MADGEGRRGPLVHRAVHHGALAWIVGTVQFVVAMAVVELGWDSPTAYSLRSNYISDLGNTKCADFPVGSTRYVCSPWHLGFDISVVVLGLLTLLGVVLVRTAFAARSSRTLGLGLLALGGIGSIGVGFSPENVNTSVHVLSATVAFAGANLGLLLLGFAMFRDTRWNGYRAYTMLSGLVGLVALVLYASKVFLGLGVGGMERVIVAPALLWMVVVSVHLVRIPAFAPRILPTGSTR